MKNSRIAPLMLVADLVICTLGLLCISHELYFAPVLDMMLLVRIWVGFSTYRRSRMVICPIVLLAVMTFYVWVGPYDMCYDLFLMPWFTLARGALSLFGADRGVVDTVFDSVWSERVIINIAAAVGSVWMFVLPLGVYIYRAVKKQLLPGRLSLRRNIWLCIYLLAVAISLRELTWYMYTAPIIIFGVALLLIPLLFNRGKVAGLFSRGEVAFMATLALLAVGYICGVMMEEKTILTASLLPAVFYIIVNRWLQREPGYREILIVLLGSVCFTWAQYTIGAIRLGMLLLAAALTAAVAIRFAVKTRKYWTGVGLFVMMALVIPVLCIGYNPYSVLEAKRVRVSHDYIKSPCGLLCVQSKNGKGVRDRFGIVLPAEYRKVRILQRWRPYFQVGDEGAWQIYDIERHELVGDERFSEILPLNDTTFVLKSDAGDRYLLLPRYYDRRARAQQAVITDHTL